MKSRREDPEIAWRYCPRIEPGVYSAFSRAARIYWDGGFRRWVCAVQFDIFDDSGNTIAQLTWFMNLCSGEKPRMGRRSNFWMAWMKANGGQPKRADRLSVNVFKTRHATVAVRDTAKNYNQVAVKPEDGYSVVAEVLRWNTGDRRR